MLILFIKYCVYAMTSVIVSSVRTTQQLTFNDISLTVEGHRASVSAYT